MEITVSLKQALKDYDGNIYFEFSIPRLGKRVDCLVIIRNVVFAIEFKVGEKEFPKLGMKETMLIPKMFPSKN